jgi:hypothetical protein
MAEHGREFFTGRPIWKDVNGQSTANHPEGYDRSVDGATGALLWSHPMIDDVSMEAAGFWD